jgi:hypothetical protein
MPNTLRTSLDALAADLTAAIIRAIQASSLAEILDIPPAPHLPVDVQVVRRARRSRPGSLLRRPSSRLSRRLELREDLVDVELLPPGRPRRRSARKTHPVSADRAFEDVGVVVARG